MVAKMKKHLRTVKTTIVLGIIFLSLIIAIVPSNSAKPLSVATDVKMTYNAAAANEKIVPLSGEITIPINISAKIRGFLATTFERLFKDRTDFSISLSVKETPEWCTARVSPNVVNPRILTQWNSEEAYVHVSFKETAPAHVPTIITIQMDASAKGTLGYVTGEVRTADISFTPSYLPIIDAIPRSTLKEISPGEIVIFYIDLENLGNAETEFIFKVTEVPKGWSASMLSSIKVGSTLQNQNPKDTVELRIQPPFDFGYHHEQEDIRVEVYGKYYASLTEQELKSDTYELTFTVRNRGFSTPGFEASIFIIAFIGVILIIKKRQKIK
jgi:hypothetical protein